jgi:hypothetical protein
LLLSVGNYIACMLLIGGATSLLSASNLQSAETTHKVRVSVLARTTSVHSSGGNQDVYLVKVQPKSGKFFYGRVFDDYPFYQEGLPLKLTSGAAPFTLEMRRDPFCDLSAYAIVVAKHVTAADLIASEEGNQDLSLQGDAKDLNTEVLPCFAAVHKTWKYEGRARDAEWWR